MMMSPWFRTLTGQQAPAEPESPLTGALVFVLTEGILADGDVRGVYSSLSRAQSAIHSFDWHKIDDRTWVRPGSGSLSLQITRVVVDDAILGADSGDAGEAGAGPF